MLKKNRLKNINIRFFIIPFTLILLLFAVISYQSVNNHINRTYDIVERQSIAMAESYTRRVINAQEATEIITGLLDDKLLIASEAILGTENKNDNEVLKSLAQKYHVDEIYLYNYSGEIINSTDEDLIGWKPKSGHPVHDFMIGDRDSFTEDVRADTESGIFYKFAYFKDQNNFIQIGVLADNFNEFLQKFTLQQLLKDIMANEEVTNVLFTDTDFNLAASGRDDFVEIDFGKDEAREHFMLDKAKAGDIVVDGVTTLHVCAPVFYKDERVGTLTIIWPPEFIADEIRNIILNNILRLILVVMILGGVLYYAYLKNRSNFEIAYYDRLTGLPNYEYLKEYLNQKISESSKNKRTAVFMLNCENFSIVNITFGFDYGDHLLQQMADSCKKELGPEDILFRHEADRFILTVNGYKRERELTTICMRLMQAFEDPAYDMCKHGYLTLKIAIYEIRDQNISTAQVLQNLSYGLAALKGDANNHYVIHDQKMRDKLKREELIEKTLMEAIQGEYRDHFHLVYQPQLDIKTNKIVAFEALARMDIKGVGSIPPTEFIKIAEKRSLIFPLGNSILKEACGFVSQLAASGHPDVKIAVNISGIQLLRDEFIDIVKYCVQDSQIDYKCLEFEITESILVEKNELVNQKLEELKNLGITLALDDFGTGYSSFAELSDLKTDTIKIDRVFIEKIGRQIHRNYITGDIIAMAHKLGLTVVAEGVENEEQRDYLKKYECDIIQGYYFSKPLAPADVLELLKNHKVSG